MAQVTPNQAACAVKAAGGSQAEAGQLLSVIPGESGFNSDATNPNSGACGIWQILPPEPGCNDPNQAAKIALRKLREQGLGAWSGGVTGDFKDQIAQAWNGDCQGIPDTSGGISTKSASNANPLSAIPFQAFIDKFVAFFMVGGGLTIVGIASYMMFSGTSFGKTVNKMAGKAAMTAAEIGIMAPK